MNPHIRQFGARPNAPPRVLEVGEMGTGRPARDQPGIVLVAQQGLQQTHRRRRQGPGPAASLCVGQVQLAGLQVDLLPAKLLDLRMPAAGKHQQPGRGSRGAGLSAVASSTLVRSWLGMPPAAYTVRGIVTDRCSPSHHDQSKTAARR